MRKSNKFGIVKKILVDFIKQRKTDKLALSIFADFANCLDFTRVFKFSLYGK
jgi:hypothetical protein